MSTNRIELQWHKVVRYIPMYMGYSEEPQQARLEEQPYVYDREGWDCDGNTAGYWEVYESFVAFRRYYPKATFRFVSEKQGVLVYTNEDED